MLKIIYTKSGISVSDFTAMEWAKATLWEYKPGENKIIRISSEVCLRAFELLVIRGNIRKEEIEFYFEDTKFIYDDVVGLRCPSCMQTMPFTNISYSISDIIIEKLEESRDI